MLKKLAYLLAVILIMLQLQNCAGPRYAVPDFYERASHHRVIAVLPFEMVFTGKKPKKLTFEQVHKIEEIESISFQSSLYHALHYQKTQVRHPILVNIQPHKKTNRLLEREGISIRQSWNMDPEELSRILGVDAVVRARVRKHRYMSNLASFGLELGAAILDVLTDSILGIFIDTRTKDIVAECLIINGADGSVLWAAELSRAIDWSQDADHIIDRLNYYFARKFPYR